MEIASGYALAITPPGESLTPPMSEWLQARVTIQSRGERSCK